MMLTTTNSSCAVVMIATHQGTGMIPKRRQEGVVASWLHAGATLHSSRMGPKLCFALAVYLKFAIWLVLARSDAETSTSA